ncbi:hypothetical protein S245_062875, partial [Arachis hypogaea]
MEESLTNGNVFQIDFGNSVTATVYASDKSSSCFLTNANTTTDATVSFRGRTYVVPAWSSLLPNCQNEEYNKAKVNVQTSVMVKVSNKAEDEPMSLNWTWRAENVDHALLAKVNASESAHELIDQKDAADDASDYLWYITRLQLDQDDLVWSDDMSLRINGSGQHPCIRSHWATYGIHNDKKGDETIIKYISQHKWLYTVGFHGGDHKFFSSDSLFASPSKWESQSLPTNRIQLSRLLWGQTLLWWTCKVWAKAMLRLTAITSAASGRVTWPAKMVAAMTHAIIAANMMTQNVFTIVESPLKDGKVLTVNKRNEKKGESEKRYYDSKTH